MNPVLWERKRTENSLIALWMVAIGAVTWDGKIYILLLYTWQITISYIYKEQRLLQRGSPVIKPLAGIVHAGPFGLSIWDLQHALFVEDMAPVRQSKESQNRAHSPNR